MFECQNCGKTSATKLGRCPDCGEFGSFLNKISDKDKSKSNNSLAKGNIIQGKTREQIEFLRIQNDEFQRIFQRGFKKGGVYLLSGAPGIGKSTIILQIIQDILNNNQNTNIAYFSGEENIDQITDRMERLEFGSTDRFNIYHTSKLEDIIATSKEHNYDMIILDSIQTAYSTNNNYSSGSISQVKNCSEIFQQFCKENKITGFIIGHITKSGKIAGPKYLEHIVDTVVHLEGDKFGQYRFLRCKKNRFGSTDNTGIFEMTSKGLKPAYNLKKKIIQNSDTSMPGSVLTVGIDNGRPVIAHLEVLLNKTYNKYPDRTSIGISSKRLSQTIAILEKYLNLKLNKFDIYVNLPGEFKFFDSGLDLAIGAAIYSQYKNITVKNSVFLGELGLGGQVLKSKLHKKRLKQIPKDFEIIDHNTIGHIKGLTKKIYKTK